MSSCSDSDLSCCQNCGSQQENTDLGAFKQKSYNSKKENKYCEIPDTQSKKTNKLNVAYQPFDQENTEHEASEEDEDEDEDDMFKLKSSAADLRENKNEFDNSNYSPSLNKKSFKSKSHLNDQVENTRNTLSHEANYKLSKKEQDASEKKKDFSWNWGIFKRSYKFNPMNEIKLKTSSRLMKKGFGASLPSYALGETRQDLMISKTLREKEQEILKEKQRKFGNNEDMDNLEEAFGENFEGEPLDYDIPVKRLQEWNLNDRKKRISEETKRVKREVLENVKNINKTKKKNDELENGHFEVNNTKFGNVIDLNKTFKPAKALNSHNINEFSSNKNQVLLRENMNAETTNFQKQLKSLKAKKGFLEKNKALKRRKRSLQQEKSLALITRNISLMNANNTRSFSLNSKAFTNKRRFIKNLKTKSLKKALKRRRAKKHVLKKHNHIKNKKAFKSYITGNGKSKALNNLKNQKLSFKSITNLKAISSRQVTLNNKTKPLKLLKRVKRFNPSATLNLKIYQKFHSPKALSAYNSKNLRNKQLRKHHTHFRAKRSITSNFLPLRNGAEKNEFWRAFVKSLKRKALTLQSTFKRLIKRSVEYFDLNKLFNKNLTKSLNITKLSEKEKKALLKHGTKEEITNSATESFKINTTLKSNKINRRDKWRYLKENLTNVLNFNKSFKDFKETNFADYDRFRTGKIGRRNIIFKENSDESNRSKSFLKRLKLLNEEVKSKQLELDLSNVTLEQNFNVERSEIKSLKLKSFELNRPQSSGNTDRNIKRSKRSLEINFNQNNDKNQESLYLPDFNDLYTKPDFIELSDQKRNKFKNFQRSYENVFKPNLFENNNFNELYKLKEKNVYKNSHENPKFNTPWFNDRKLQGNHKYHKRFTKSKKLQNPQQKSYFKNNFKRHNLNLYHNNISDLSNHLGIMEFPEKVQKLKDQYLSDLQNFNENYKFNENHFNWPKLKTIMENFTDIKTTTDNGQNLSQELRNEILNCKAFSSLEDFIKSLPKNITDLLIKDKLDKMETTTEVFITEKIEIDMQTPDQMEKTTFAGPTLLDSTIICTTTTENPAFPELETVSEESITEEPESYTESVEDYEQPTVEEDLELETIETSSDDHEDITTSSTSVPVLETLTESSNASSDNGVKLNITFKASVEGNPETNHYSGNGSFNVEPGLANDERLRRDAIISPLENLEKREFAQTPAEKLCDSEDDEDLTDLISGKYSSSLVNSIFQVVRDTPHLKELWPSLQHNQLNKRADIPNFYAIKNQKNAQQLKDYENLLTKVMTSLNSIIEEQARSHACVPLKPDLQEFYNMIVKSRHEQEMRNKQKK
ncbi:uncharacterized protein ACRADG_010739 isoform 2-T2 [Cochliomyia hominivorax]